MSDKVREEFLKMRSGLAGQMLQGNDWESAYRAADEIVSYASFEAGWQASRQALVVELPAPFAYVGDYAACGGRRILVSAENTDLMCRKIPVYDRAAIEAAGVKVKP